MGKDQINVLLIEDNPGDIRLIREALAEIKDSTINLEQSAYLAEGLMRLAGEIFDAILLDLSLPDSKGLDTVSRVYNQAPETPILVLTGLDDELVAAQAVRQGAEDYLVKGQTDGNLLIRAIRYAIERKNTEKALRASEAKYRTIFETTGNATVIIEEDTILSLVNSEFEKLSEYSKEEIEGKMRLREFVVKDDLDKMYGYRRLLLTFPDSAPRNYEFRFINKTGGTRDLFATISTVPGTRMIIASFLDISERKLAERELKYLSFHDRLTGLYNRVYVEEEIIKMDVSVHLPISIIMGNTNGLKLFNDAFGHQEGDKLLIDIASILQNSCRQEDIVARWGGDEFTVIMPRTSQQMAMEVCEKIRRSCNEVEKYPIRPSIALGVATKEEQSQKIDRMIKEAEDRMYRNKLVESKNTRSSILYSLQKTLEEKTSETEEHALRIKDFAIAMGNVVGLSANQLDELALLAVLHDIGKIAVPESILTKPEPLTLEEWEIIKKHPEVGYRIAQTSYELAHIAGAILAHHERWDGKGYPQGLKGEDIPLISRIISVIDAFDVITHRRPYKIAFSLEEAINELKKCTGNQFDPNLVNIFINMLSNLCTYCIPRQQNSLRINVFQNICRTQKIQIQPGL